MLLISIRYELLNSAFRILLQLNQRRTLCVRETQVEPERDRERFQSFWEIWVLHQGHSGLFEKCLLL